MKFFSPDISQFSDYYERGKYVLAWRLSLLFTLIFGVLSTLYLGGDKLVLTYYLIIFVVSLATFIILKTTKKHTFIYWTFTISASTIVVLSMFTVQHTLHYSDFLWMICIITFAFIGLGRNYGLLFLVLHLSVAIYFILFELNYHFELLVARDSNELWVVAIEVGFAFIIFSYLIHRYLTFQRYAESELTIVNSQLEKQNNENIYLVKEVHHRVKNNLQIIVSLLKMQREELKSEESKKHFSDAINRIMTISLVHDKLYAENEFTDIDLVEYLNELVLDISRLSSNKEQSIDVNISSELEHVGLKTIVPLGLLLNELLTNSYKHAFSGQKEGAISIKFLEFEPSKLKLTYEDSGKWNEDNQRGFGLELIELLTQQLEGSFKREGSAYYFQLSNLDY